MKTLAPLKPSDLRYIIARLSKETGVDEATARRAYDDAECNYKRAMQALTATRARERERAEEWRRWQRILQLEYESRIRPALIAWMGGAWQKFDPLRLPSHAFCLITECANRGVLCYPEKEGQFHIWHITSPTKNASWRSGKGISDVPQEALVLAWWQAFEDWAIETFGP